VRRSPCQTNPCLFKCSKSSSKNEVEHICELLHSQFYSCAVARLNTMSSTDNGAEGVLCPTQADTIATNPGEIGPVAGMQPANAAAPRLTSINVDTENNSPTSVVAANQPARVYINGWRLYLLTFAYVIFKSLRHHRATDPNTCIIDYAFLYSCPHWKPQLSAPPWCQSQMPLVDSSSGTGL
jgi:hypothetical protein